MKHKSKQTGSPHHELMDGPRHTGKSARYEEDNRGSGRLNARTWALKALNDWELNTPTDEDEWDEPTNPEDDLSFDISYSVDASGDETCRNKTE
jgi:hypothetical protein